MAIYRVTITRITGIKNSKRNTQPYEVNVTSMDFNAGSYTPRIGISDGVLPYNNDGPHESPDPKLLWSQNLVFDGISETAPLCVTINADHRDWGLAGPFLPSDPKGGTITKPNESGKIPVGNYTVGITINTLHVNGGGYPPKPNDFKFDLSVAEVSDRAEKTAPKFGTNGGMWVVVPSEPEKRKKG